MRFVAILNLLYIFHHVHSFEQKNNTLDDDLELSIDSFSQIIGSESPHKIYKSTSSQQNSNYDVQNPKLMGYSNERNGNAMQESHTSVLCDTDKNKTGGERKQFLISAGVDSSSVTTILNNENRTCYIVHMTDSEFKNVSKHYSLLPLSSTMKLRSETINRIVDSKRSTPIVIETLNFESKSMGYANGTTEAERFREKVMDFTKKDILGQALYEINEDALNASGAFHEKINNSTEVSDICEKSYNHVYFASIDENLVNNLMKMQVDATQMERYILDNYNASTSSISAKDLFETCILTLIMSMSLQPEVCSIEIEPQYKLFNEHIQYLVQSITDHKYPWYEVGLNGTGEVVALSDAGIDINNCYFWDKNNYLKPGSNIDLSQRKIVQYDNYADNGDLDYGHGTHVAGTICGKRSVDGVKESRGIADGVAFESKVAFIDIGDENYNIKIPSVDRLLNVGRPYAKIHSASWGIDYGQYDTRAAQIDAYLNQNDDFVFVVAAGNAGSNNKFNSIASPAVAKNVIAVGASETFGSGLAADMLGPSYIAGFSSRGPTADGRTKPDIIAPGYWVISAGSQNKKVGECDPLDKNDIPGAEYEGKYGLLSMAGTSQATPAVSGVLAMIRQYFRDGFYPTGKRMKTHSMNPSGALLKAVLLNGGQDLIAVNNKPDDPSAYPNIYPSKPYDNIQSFGRVSLSDSLYIKGKSNLNAIVFDRITIKEGKTKKFPMKVHRFEWCTSNDFSVTLVWMDKPGFTNCIDSCIINDLDLYVTKSSDTSRIFHPNGRDSKDSKNTVERVRIKNDLQNGEVFYVYVRAANFDSPYESQAFALVATGCIMGEGEEVPPTPSPTLQKPITPFPTNERIITSPPNPIYKNTPNPTIKKTINTPRPSRSKERYANTILPTKKPTRGKTESSKYDKDRYKSNKDNKEGKEKYFYTFFGEEEYSKERDGGD